MKNLTFLLCLLLPLQSFGQGIDNDDSLDATFSETRQLTDQQADESQTFVHQGLRDKALKEKCKDKLLKDCDPNYPNQMGVLLGGIENQIGMLYAVIFGLGGNLMGGGGQAASSSAASTGSATKTAKTKDYCIYIPIAYEAISFAMQMGGQKRAEQDTANLDPQLAALAQLKEAHKTRKKTATMQSAVYGTTTACYGVMLMTKSLDPSTMVYVKMGASAALTALFMAKAGKHGKAADKVQEVIDSLPKAGDCNPWTGTACFCAEKTSAKLYPGQYQEVCVLNKGNFAGGKDNFGCAVQVNGKPTLDPTCGCKATNSCLSDSKLSFGQSTLGMGANFVNDANKGLQLLDPSQFDEAKLNAFSSNMAGKANTIKPAKSIATPKLNPKQKALADDLSTVAPASVAAVAASLNPAGPPVGGLMGGSTASALDRLPPSLKKDMKDFEVSGNYRGGGGSSTGSAAVEPSFSIPGMGAPQEPQGGVQIEEYAAKAVGQADVRNTPDVAIFDIISNRYRNSAWKRLDTQGN